MAHEISYVYMGSNKSRDGIISLKDKAVRVIYRQKSYAWNHHNSSRLQALPKGLKIAEVHNQNSRLVTCLAKFLNDVFGPMHSPLFTETYLTKLVANRSTEKCGTIVALIDERIISTLSWEFRCFKAIGITQSLPTLADAATDIEF